MTDKDVQDMAQLCIEEISMLRSQVAALQPRADAYDSIERILRLIPQPAQGYGEDIVWRLRKQIEELQPKNEVAEADA